MANINALIAAGPHTQGVDARGNAMAVQQINTSKARNALYDLQAQNAPAVEARAAAQESRLQNQEDRLQATYETKEEIGQAYSLSKLLSRNDIQGALDLVSQNGITEKEQQVYGILTEALKTGDTAPLEGINQALRDTLDRSLFMGDVKQPAAKNRDSKVVNGNLVDAGTGEVIYSAPEDATSSKSPIKLTEINPETNETEEFLAHPATGIEIQGTRRVTKAAPGPSATEIKAGETKSAKQAAERSLITKMEIFGEIMGNERFSNVVGPRDAGLTSKAVGSFFNTDDSQLFRRLEQMSGKEVLRLGGEVLKGSQTEGEWERVALAIPQPKDHEGVWAQWYSDAIRTITSGAPHLAEKLEPLRVAIVNKYGIEDKQAAVVNWEDL